MGPLSRAQKIRLGVFVGTGIALLFGSFMILAGRAMLEKRDLYTIRFSNKSVTFSGLDPGSDVKYSGIKIGRVERVGIAGDDVSIIEVNISVEGGTPIASNTRGSVASLGITGLKYVELSRGSPDVPLLKPGDTIPAGETLIDELSAKALTISEKLDQLLRNIETMTGEDAQASFQGILTSTAGILDDNREHIAGILSDAREVTANVARASEGSVAVVERADQLMVQLSLIGETLKTTIGPEGELQQTLKRSGELIERVNMMVLRSEQDLDISLSNLREASANLSDFSLELRENPTILIKDQNASSAMGTR